MKVMLVAIPFLLMSCTSSVVTTKPLDKNLEAGFVYYLPKQLVKVEFTRKAIDTTAAYEAVQKADASLKDTTAKLTAINKELVEVEDELKVASTAADPANYANELQKRKTALMIQKLRLTELKRQQEGRLNGARQEYALSIASETAFIEKIILTPTEPQPDMDKAFVAQIDHSFSSSDSIQLATKSGLLSGAIGHSEDKTADIIVSLAGAYGGITGVLGSKMGGGAKLWGAPPGACEKKPAVSISQTIDPNDMNDVQSLNNKLRAEACLELRINGGIPIPEDKASGVKCNEKNSSKKCGGLLYRQPGVYTFGVYDQAGTLVEQTKVPLAQAGRIGLLPFPKGRLAKNEYDVAFENGILKHGKVSQPSELLGAVMIIPNALKAVFAIPTELIQFKVDYSSREKAIAENTKAMLEIQAAIEKQQLQIEATDASE